MADPDRRPNGDPLNFVIASVTQGATLTKNGAAAGPGTPLSAGETLVWTPPAGSLGTVPAFTVVAATPGAASATPVQVSVVVSSFAVDLSGPWNVNGGLARISQTGSGITFVGPDLVGISGKFTGPGQVIKGTVPGVIDNSIPFNQRILFNDGTVWNRILLTGTWSHNGATTRIGQTGVSLTLINEFGAASTGTISSATTLQAPGFNLTGVFTNNNQITFSDNSVWIRTG